MRKEHFGKLYPEIFSDLNAAQAVLAVQIFRAVENARKRAGVDQHHAFLPYSAHYIAMLIGERLLDISNLTLSQVNHRNFIQLQDTIKFDWDIAFLQAMQQVGTALVGLYGDRPISLQQLSATFRRGDLLEVLQHKVDK